MIIKLKAHLNGNSLKPEYKDQVGIALPNRLSKIYRRIRSGKLYGLESKDVARSKIEQLTKIEKAIHLTSPHVPSELDRAFKIIRYFPATREFEIEVYKPIPIGPNTKIGIAYLFNETGEQSEVIDAVFAYPLTVETTT